ncbi:hypothetical protein MMC16_002894 [Acarospora aff. strigata]|nr:hypothetical protein [Acarospora aff. strigata]
MSPTVIRDQLANVHDDRSGQIATVAAVMIAVATVAVALRLFTRWLIATSWKLDDYAIMAALGLHGKVLDFGLFATQIVGIQYGSGKHAVALDADTIQQNLKVLLAGELIYVTCLFAIKISILSLYYRLFQSHSRTFNIAVYLTACFTVAGWLTTFFVFLLQCDPMTYAFDKSIRGHCVNIKAICVATSVINVVINILLLTLPLPVVWHLHVSKCQKLAISGMFLLGGSVVVVSIIRIPILMSISLTDITWTQCGVATWSLVEISIGIFSACLPVMRPLLRRFALRPTPVAEAHSMHRTCLPPFDNDRDNRDSNGKRSAQRLGSDESTNSRSKLWHDTEAEAGGQARPSPYRITSDTSVKQWRDPTNMHPGDLWHVANASHGSAFCLRTEGAGRAGPGPGPDAIEETALGQGIYSAV